jgi:ATP-dependent RNA helicase DeaD
LANPSDIVALAKTGTGKTAAFGIPLVEKLKKGEGIQALVLSPTRELAAQTALSLKTLSKFVGLHVATIVGGVSYDRQDRDLRANPEIVVSTPGRLIDLLDQGRIELTGIKVLILDEADEMLSIGFKEALDRILSDLKDEKLERWMFSATMSEGVRKVSSKYLNKPIQIAVAHNTSPVLVKNCACVVFEEDKTKALELLLQQEPEFYGIIFAGTKKQVAETETRLRAMGFAVESLHGDKVQADRARIFDRMKTRKTKILVATDVAARGLDIQGLTHVVNYEVPWDVETYTHRIGRTGRAGLSGTVWTFVKPKEVGVLKKFERSLNFKFEDLKVPTSEDIAFQKTKVWLDKLMSQPVDVKDFKHDLFQEAMLKLKLEQELVVDDASEQWIFKALLMSGIFKGLSWEKPRIMTLDRAMAPRAHDSRSGGGSYDRRPSRYPSRDGGGAGRRPERSYGRQDSRPQEKRAEGNGGTGVGGRWERRPNTDAAPERSELRKFEPRADRPEFRRAEPRSDRSDTRPVASESAERSERPKRPFTGGKRFHSRPERPSSSK